MKKRERELQEESQDLTNNWVGNGYQINRDRVASGARCEVWIRRMNLLLLFIKVMVNFKRQFAWAKGHKKAGKTLFLGVCEGVLED